MKKMIMGLQSVMLFLGSIAPALAEEEKKSGGYDSIAVVWYALIVIIIAYGIYDTFFKPVD